MLIKTRTSSPLAALDSFHVGIVALPDTCMKSCMPKLYSHNSF